tara:strand:- start:22361 stop:22564 length:204 start_codon:yes stop_codon:yes gene_type:complete
MIFKENNLVNQIYRRLGYVFGYFLFTTILYLILNFLNKVPKEWSYFNIMGITLLIIFLGWSINRLLK